MRIDPLAPEHAEQLFAAIDDPATYRYLTEERTTLAALRERIERLQHGEPPAGQRWFNWAVIVDDVVVGWLQVTERADHAEIAYMIGPRFQGRGHARQAVQWLIERFASCELWASIHPDNVRSIRVVEALGFRRQPVPPRRELSSYEEGDVVYALLPSPGRT